MGRKKKDVNTKSKYIEEYYCPNCGAMLNQQFGFDPSIGAWTCTECGELLMEDDIYEGERFEGVAWYCDECGALLNRQKGFSDSNDSWECSECGHVNPIGKEAIINGKLFKCPECGDILNYQSEFDSYDDNWTCTSCGANLTHGCYDDDYTVDDEDEFDSDYDDDLDSEYDDGADDYDEIDEYDSDNICPECGSNLNNQDGYDEDYEDWTCEYCGAKLHRDYDDEDYYIVDESYSGSDNDLESQISKDNDEQDRCTVLIKDESILQMIRIRAFLTSRKKVPFGYCTQHLIGDYYMDVQNRLYNQGFKKIHLKSKKDVYINSGFSDGEVESVSINGKTTISSKEMYSYNSDIVITYHEKMEIEIPFSNKKIHKKYFDDIRMQLLDLGFVNISLNPIRDLVTGWIIKNGMIEKVIIKGDTDYQIGSVFKYDVPIVIEYHTF